MQPGDTNDFDLVNFEKDRDRAFDELNSRGALVTGWQSPAGRPVFFQVQGIDPTGVRLTVIDGDGLDGTAGQTVELLFALDDGQYHWKTPLLESTHDRWTIDRGGDLWRLQRRNNFRTTVPRGYKADFMLRTLKTHQLTPTPIALADVSAGGARLHWPKAGVSPVALQDSLSGTLAVPGSRTIEIFGIVKSVLVDPSTGQVQAGLEFQNVSGRDEQALLHLCLQIRRATASVLK